MLLLRPLRERSVAQLATLSQAALDERLEGAGELTVSTVADEGLLLGAFQRSGDVEDEDPRLGRFLRGSGGPAARLGPGSVHVLLRLATPHAFVECDAPRLLNRYVRPLLRALGSRLGPASYFGREWVSVAKMPVAFVSFGHDAESERSTFEAVVAVSTPFGMEARASHRGALPATLASLGITAGRDAMAVAEHVRTSYGQTYGGVERASDEPIASEALEAAPPWAARVDEALGFVAAGRDGTGLMRLGGELMASRDVLAHLDAELVKVRAPSEETLGTLVNAALSKPRATVFGVRDAANLVRVLSEAYGTEA